MDNITLIAYSENGMSFAIDPIQFGSIEEAQRIVIREFKSRWHMYDYWVLYHNSEVYDTNISMLTYQKTHLQVKSLLEEYSEMAQRRNEILNHLALSASTLNYVLEKFELIDELNAIDKALRH